jgi:hypothetical protein
MTIPSYILCAQRTTLRLCVHVLAVNVELIDYAHTMGRPRLHVPDLAITKGEQKGLSLSPVRSNVVVVVGSVVVGRAHDLLTCGAK